jgi:hypothetical protein
MLFNRINGLLQPLRCLPVLLVPRYDAAGCGNKLNCMGKMKASAPLFIGQAGMLSGIFSE